MRIKDAIKEVVQFKDLSVEDAYEVASEIMNGNATTSQISALLISLRMKGETVDELTGFVKVMREKAVSIPCNKKDVIDTCGTGGDGKHTFNISTIAALVAAGAGCTVAKHGNRSISSICGSADLLEYLGVYLENSPEQVAQSIDKIGIGFLYAPILHRAMRYAAGPRRELGIRTIFNILGPLTNPAGARRQLIGIFDRRFTTLVAQVLSRCGAEHVMVVHGEDGLDEITNTGRTYVSEFCNGTVKNYTICPEDFGMQRVKLETIQVATIEENIECALKVLNREEGPKRDIVLLNAGAAIYISGKARNLKEGIELARASIDSGKALECLEMLRMMNA